MTKEEELFLKVDVKDICYQNVEEVLWVTKYCLVTYFKSMICFGRKHFISKDIVAVWKEFFSICFEERFLLNFLVKYSDLEDMEEVYQFIEELDLLNEETIRYYYRVLDDIETACDMRLEWKATRFRKNFDSLVETDHFRKKLCSMILSMEDIQLFLGYEEVFWEYVRTRVLVVDSKYGDLASYGVFMEFDSSNCLNDMWVIIPKIINLETALVNVHLFHQAYQLYQRLGYSLDKSDMEYEEEARSCEKRFQEDYMIKKYKRVFDKG